MITRTVQAILIFVTIAFPAPFSTVRATAVTIPNPNKSDYTTLQAQPSDQCATASNSGQASASQPTNAGCTVNRIVNRIIDDLFYLMGAIAVLMLIYAGILYVQANGNAEATKKARQNITNVVLGIIILSASYTIISLITSAANFFKPTG